jgi:hypothetical protein
MKKKSSSAARPRIKMSSPDAYRLTTPTGEDPEHSWNIDNLRKFFV